jgi:hypothetical protein
VAVVALRDDPVSKALAAAAALGDDEEFGGAATRRVALLALDALAAGHVELATLPFVVMGGLDGASVAQSIASAFSRWEALGWPRLEVLCADFARQVGMAGDDPLLAGCLVAALAAPEPRAQKFACMALAMVAMLESHGEVLLDDGWRRLALPVAVASSSRDAAVALRGALAVAGCDASLAETAAAIAEAATDPELCESVSAACRAAEDGDEAVSPTCGRTAALSGSPEAAVLAGVMIDAARVLEAIARPREARMPEFASLAGALFGRAFQAEPALAIA